MLSKTEAAGRVRQVLQSVKDRLNRGGGSKVNEATTRAHFLNPLLEALGYASIDDLLFEHYLPDGKTFLDYRLVVDGKPRVGIEAKALDVQITDAHAAQAVSYAAILGDEWSVVTNAREWRLYHAFAHAPLADKLILRADLVGWETDAQFDAVFEQLWLVSKESFQSGAGPSIWLASKKVDQFLRTALTDETSPEVKYLRRRLEAQGVDATAAQVSAWFRPRFDGVAGSITDSGGTNVESGPRRAERGVRSRREDYGSEREHEGRSPMPSYWLIPAGRQRGYSAAEHLKHWLDKGFWGFGSATPGRRTIKTGDWVCFYAAQSHEVVAYAKMSGPIERPVLKPEWPGPDMWHDDLFKVPLTEITWLSAPVELDSAMRASMDAYRGRDLAKGWSWLVQTTRRLTEADFRRLTRR